MNETPVSVTVILETPQVRTIEVAKQGPRGLQGERGLRGMPGLQGDPGPEGPPGPDNTLALREDLGSGEAGKGAELLMWAGIRGAEGAIQRPVHAKLAESISPFDFGAVGDGNTDDTHSLQLWINCVQGLTRPAFEGPAGRGYCPAGYRFRITSSLTVDRPCDIECRSMIEYWGDSGSALIIGAEAPVNGRNSNYKLVFAGFRHQGGGNTSHPTAVASRGANGVEVRGMQFSYLEVGRIIAFTGAGFFANSTQDCYAYQHIQQNVIRLGEIAYNGVGFLALSKDAEGAAFQANNVTISDIFVNFRNIDIDDGAAHLASSSNVFTVSAMDHEVQPGTGLRNWAAFNTFNFGFIEGSVIMMPTSYHCTVRTTNNFSSGAIFNDQGTRNWMQTCTPAETQLPAQIGVTSGQTVVNAFGVPVSVYITATLTPTTNASAYVELWIGLKSDQMMQANVIEQQAMSNPLGVRHQINFHVPPFACWQVKATGAGSTQFSAATCIQSAM